MDLLILVVLAIPCLQFDDFVLVGLDERLRAIVVELELRDFVLMVCGEVDLLFVLDEPLGQVQIFLGFDLMVGGMVEISRMECWQLGPHPISGEPLLKFFVLFGVVGFRLDGQVGGQRLLQQLIDQHSLSLNGIIINIIICSTLHLSLILSSSIPSLFTYLLIVSFPPIIHSHRIIIQQMAQKNTTSLMKMQEIANRLISNTPELAKMLDNDSALKPKRPNPDHKKNKPQSIPQTHLGKNEMTANDYHQKCKELSLQVVVWKQRCQSLQEQIGIIKQRFVERQIQYRGIIEQLQLQIKSKSCLDNNDRNRMQQIGELHKEIIDNISTIQNKTSKILIEQESDIRRFFNKKINEIKEKFKEDKLNKNEKDQEYQQKEKQMASELEWIKNIAHKIDEENKSLMKKYSTLKSEFEIQERDKEMLMKQLLMKKKENVTLKTQVEQYEKLLNEVSRQMEENKEDFELVKSRSVNHQPDNSKLKTQKSNLSEEKRYENTIGHLNKIIGKERSKIRELKNLYMKELNSKSQLQKIIRKLVQDAREEIYQIQKEKSLTKKKGQQLNAKARKEMLEKLLNNEKILTLIYDKTFYSSNRQLLGQAEMPPELKKVLEDNDSEGFD